MRDLGNADASGLVGGLIKKLVSSLRDSSDDGDLIVGTLEEDEISAGGGNDIVFASRLNDTVDGEDGNDVIFAGAGADKVSGGDGTDVIVGRSGRDTIEGGEGDDFIFMGPGEDTLVYTEGDGFDIVTGFDPDDVLVLDVGADNLRDLRAEVEVDVLEGGTLVTFGNGDGIFFNGSFLEDFSADNLVLIA